MEKEVRSVFKYINLFANQALEGLGIDSLLDEIKTNDSKYQLNYTNYNAMMLGYFMSSDQYHDKYLATKYINELCNIETTPSDFINLFENNTSIEQGLNEKKQLSDWYKKFLISFEMGKISREIIDCSEKKEEIQTSIYDVAYSYEKAFEKKETLKTDENSFQLKKALI